MEKLRKISVLVLAAGCFILLLIFLSLLLLASGQGEDFVRGKAEGKLSELSGRPVTIGLLETNIFSRLVLKDLVLSSDVSADSSTTLSIADIRIDYRLSRIFKRKITIEAALVSGLHLSLVRLPDGSVDIPLQDTGKAREEKPNENGWKVELLVARIDASSLSFHDCSSCGRSASILFKADASAGRPDGSYDLDLSLSEGKFTDSLLAIDGIEARLSGRQSSTGTGIDSLSVTFPGLKLLGSGELRSDGADRGLDGRFGIECDLAAAMSQIAEAPGRPFAHAAGQLRIDAVIGGSLDDPSVQWKLESPRIEAGDISIFDTYIEGALSGSSVDVDSIETEIFGGRLAGRGNISIDSIGTTKVRLKGGNFSLEEILAAVHQHSIDYSGNAGFDISLDGPVSRPGQMDVSILADLSELVYSGRPAGDLDVTLRSKNGLFALDAIQRNNSLSAEGSIVNGIIEARYSLGLPDPAPLAALAGVTGLRGEVYAHGTLSGKIASPSLAVTGTGRDLEYRGIPLDTVSFQAGYSAGSFELDKVTFSCLKKEAGQGGESDLLSGLSGWFSYDGEIASWPADPSGRLYIRTSDLAYDKYKIDGAVFSMTLDSGRAGIETLHVKTDSFILEGNGYYILDTGKGALDVGLLLEEGQDRTETGRLHLGFERDGASGVDLTLDLEEFELPVLSLMLEDSLGGKADAHVKALVRSDSIAGALDIFITGPSYGRAGADSIYISSRYTGGTSYLDSLSIWRGPNSATATARLVSGKDERGLPVFSNESGFSGRLRTDGLDISAAAEFMAEGMQPAGLVRADLEWTGKMMAPLVEGTLTLQQGRLRLGPGKAALDSLGLRATLHDSTIIIDSFSGLAGDLPFTMKGELIGRGLPWIDVGIELQAEGAGSLACSGGFSSDSLDFSISIDDLDLDILEPFLPQVKDLSGRINAELDVKGRPTGPRARGSITGNGLGVLPRDIDLPVTDGTIDMTFEQRRIRIDSLSAHVTDGLFSITGEIGLGPSGPDDFDLMCVASGLDFSRKDLYSVKLQSADLNFRTRDGYHLLGGEVILGETKLVAKFRPQSILPFTRSIEKPRGEVPDFLSKIRLDVRIRGDGNLWVDNNLARLSLGASLNLIGYASNPNASGRVTVSKGYLIFLDRKLEISKGIIDFIDPDMLNPIVDIEAGTIVRTYRGLESVPYDIKLSVKGKLDEARVTLTSSPPLDRADIVSLLSIGMTRGQLSGRNDQEEQASFGGVVLERAKQLSTRRMANYVSGKVGSALGLDQLTVEGDLFNPDREQGATLRATKKISTRAEIIYTTGIGHINDQRIRLEYRLTKRISVQSETDQAGRSGLDFKYRLRFR